MSSKAALWLAVAVLAVHAVPVTTSLWLDESGTRWMISGGFTDMWHRALWWSATSPLYYSTAWIWSRAFGVSETALRALSTLFSIVSGYALYRLATRWLDRAHAVLAVGFFWSIPIVGFTVIDARPYALGLLALICAWLSTIRWVESPSWMRGATAICAAAAVVWVHYTLALGLIPLVYYGPRVGWRRATIAAFAVAVLLMPLVWQLADTVHRRGVLSWAREPSLLDLAVSVLAVFLPLVTFGLLGSGSRLSGPAFRASFAPVIALAVVPAVVIFLMGRLHYAQLFVPRYMVGKEIGAAILAAAFTSRLPTPDLRAMAVAVQIVAVLAANTPWSGSHGGEDWRAAADLVKAEKQKQPQTTLAAVSGFVESLRAETLDDPRYRDILLAPLGGYGVEEGVILLPSDLTGDVENRLSRSVIPVALRTGRLILVNGHVTADYVSVMTDRLTAAGLTLSRTYTFEGVEARVFERTRTEPRENESRGRSD